METKKNNLWVGLSIASFVCAVVPLWLGFDKMFFYENGEYSWSKVHNAYVGGDAYNYIINSNYATGFFVLAAALALMGVGFLIVHFLSRIYEQQSEMMQNSALIQNSVAKIEQNTYPTVPSEEE